MRVWGGMRRAACAALVVAGSFAVAPLALAGFPSPPPQCGGYNAILDYYATLSDFTGTGLSIGDCTQLCKKAASKCKDAIGKASSCAKKAISDQAGFDRKESCKPLTGQEEKDCKTFFNDQEDAARQIYQDAAPVAKDQCEAIRTACISDCED